MKQEFDTRIENGRFITEMKQYFEDDTIKTIRTEMSIEKAKESLETHKQWKKQLKTHVDNLKMDLVEGVKKFKSDRKERLKQTRGDLRNCVELIGKYEQTLSGL